MPCRHLKDESPEELGPGDSSSKDEHVLRYWVTADPASLYTQPHQCHLDWMIFPYPYGVGLFRGCSGGMGEGQASLTSFSSRTFTSAGTQHLHLDFLLLDAPVSTVLKSKFSFLLFICFSLLVPARRSPIGAGTVAGSPIGAETVTGSPIGAGTVAGWGWGVEWDCTSSIFKKAGIGIRG